MAYPQALEIYESLQPGDRVQVQHEVKVGFRSWNATTTGTVVKKERRRHSLHFNRNFDDKVFSDVIILRHEDGELTTVTLDEFSELTRLESVKDAADDVQTGKA
jgi:ribosomal protein L34